MQVSYFDRNGPCAGFVVHKITCPESAMRFSAWYDAKGNFVDAEGIDALGRSRKAPESVMPRLLAIGRQYAYA
jgi:hypothetical protein